MPTNIANRQVCNMCIRYRDTNEQFLYFETANTNTVNLQGDSTFAKAKSVRKIQFANPLEGTMKVTAQIYPYKLYTLMSGSDVENSAAYAKRIAIPCVVSGELDFNVSGGNVKTNTLFAYPIGQYGQYDHVIACSCSGNKILGAFTQGSVYEVGFIVTRDNGVKHISFKNSILPREYAITMSTIDKNECGELTPFLIVIYRAVMDRTFELTFSQNGDPAEIEMTFQIIEDNRGNVLDMVEIADLSTFEPADVLFPYNVTVVDDIDGNVVMTFVERESQ